MFRRRLYERILLLPFIKKQNTRNVSNRVSHIICRKTPRVDSNGRAIIVAPCVLCIFVFGHRSHDESPPLEYVYYIEQTRFKDKHFTRYSPFGFQTTKTNRRTTKTFFNQTRLYFVGLGLYIEYTHNPNALGSLCVACSLFSAIPAGSHRLLKD